MGLAFTRKPISYAPAADASTPAALKAAIDAAALAAGWVPEDISGGRRYAIKSPQGLTAKIEVCDAITPAPKANRIQVRFMSLDGTKIGYPHRLYCVAGRLLAIWANCCQLFIAVPGYATGDSIECSLQGGIPYVAEPLTGDCPSGSVSECWWSAGDAAIDINGNEVREYSLRSSWIGARKAFSACYNGDLAIAPFLIPYVYSGNYSDGSPEMIRLTTTTTTTYGQPKRILKWNGKPFYTDPLIGWFGSGSKDSPPIVRAQLWDSVEVSEYRSADVEEVWDGLTWISYMAQQPGIDFASGLMLLKQGSQGGGGLANYAF